MKRYERTRILVEGNPEIARQIASEIEKEYTVEILDDPHEELIMVKARESAQNSLFYLGEALMCSCRVRLDHDVVGFGFLLGDRREAAYNLALVDAAFSHTKQVQRLDEWNKLISKEALRLKVKQAKDQYITEKTRVDFSVMDSDD